ncbi:Rib/alpha-like domain-containing protein [Lactobacillus sp. ESL0701]|uniref:Rib/alpha-like domain-containing protein n=1 Tax=Lactobacillus sp. ESL0701 TaxID=2983217 RepID=UPI0023F910B3|nr:Rib/alpha-like domain-containing protein [Lactobacillus sp. ESL0701]MDF7672221.1 Rib/alpha-like domain-containing protein [Lactobacillus sp. ESL0701]
MQSKKDRFSIRKLTVGAASVLLGFSFMAINGQTAKADTISSSDSDTEVQTSKNATTVGEDKQESASDKTSTNANLATYSGLSSFLKSATGAEENSTNKEQEKPATPTPSDPDSNETAKPVEDPNTADANEVATGAAIKPNNATNANKQLPTAQANEADVSTWEDFKTALTSENVETINVTGDIAATDSNQTYTIPISKIINGNNHTLNIGSNIIQDDVYEYGITFNDIKLMGMKPNDDPTLFNFYGYDNDKAVTLNNVESDNVSYDALINFENDVQLNYNTDGNIFSDYAEPTATTGSTVTIDFAPTTGTSTSFICDIFIIEDNAHVTAHIANTMSALRGTGTIDNARIEVGENSTFDLTIDPTVNFLYRVDSGIPPLKLELFKGSSTHIQNNASDTGVNPGKDNQLILIADTPKIFELKSNSGDVNNFNFPETDISGAKMGLIDDQYKWIIQDSDNANIIDPNLTDAQMQILANPTLPENILADGKANKTFQDLSTKEDFQTVIQSAGGFNGSAGFALGTDLYDGWKKTDAGRYNISATGVMIHAGQITGIGTAQDRLNAVDSSDNSAPTLAHLLELDDSINPSNKTITGIAWLPNQAMDANGELIAGGLVKDEDGNLIDDVGSQVETETTNLGNAVIRVTYGDGTTDDIPVTLTLVKAKSSGDVQTVAHGQMPTLAQAQDAVGFDGDASSFNPTYEWYKADGSGPLTIADLQSGQTNDVKVLVTYHRNGQPDGTQLVSAQVFMGEDQATASGITAGAGLVVVHAVTIPSENEPLVPEFSDSSKWSTYLAGDLTNVTGVDWDDDTNVDDIINDATGEKTAKLRVTFSDGSTKEIDNVKVNVLGGEKADNQSTTTPNGVLPTIDQAKEALKDEPALTSALSDAGYDVDYSWAKDNQGTAMDNSYVTYSEQQPTKTVPGYVVLTYYKKGAAHTPDNIDGQQIVPVDVTINKQAANLYHDQLAGSGQNSRGVSVAKGTTMDAATAKDAIYKPDTFPADATFEWESPVDTSTTGDKPSWVKVTYADGSTDRIPVLVNVYDTASKEMPEGITQTADLNGTIPDAQTSIANNADLPSGTTYEWLNAPDLSHEGSAVGTVKVTYPDGSADYVAVPVIVGNANPTQANDPLGQRTNIPYAAGSTATDVQAKAAISNADSLPEGTTFAWQTAPIVNDLNRLGVQAAVVQVTYPDGTTNNVPVVVDVTSDAHSASRPRAKNVCVNVGAAIPDAKDAVINSADLTNATSFEYETVPSSSVAGVTQNKIKITYADGSTDEVPTQVIVNEVPTAASTEAQKNNPHVKTVRVNINSTVNASSVIDNFTELTGEPTVEWVDPNVAMQITKTEGLKQSQVKLTFSDGSVKVVTGYIRVISDGEKHADSVTGKTITKKPGATITAAEMVNDLPNDAVATFATSVNITNGKVDNPGTYVETIHIKFHDGTEKDVASVLTVPRQSSQLDYSQSKDVVLHVVNVGNNPAQTPADFSDPSSFLNNTEDANIASVDWATDGQPSVASAVDQITGKIKITFNDGTSITRDINVKVIGNKKSDTPTTITTGDDSSKLNEARAKAALDRDDLLAIDAKYPNATYSWAANGDGTGTVDISHSGLQHPYVIIDYGDGTKEAVQVDLMVNEEPTSGATYSPQTNGGSVTTHMSTNGVVMPPEFSDPAKMGAFMQIPGVTDLSSVVDNLTWANDAPTAVGDNQQFDVIIHYKDNSVSEAFPINVNVLSAKKTADPTVIAAGDSLTADQAKAALDPTENAKILAKYPNAKFSWAANSDGTGTINTNTVGTSQPYVVVDYGDGTTQIVQVDLSIKSQADTNEGNLDTTQAVPITTHIADGLHNEVNVPEFTNPTWIKENIKITGDDDSTVKIDHLSWSGAQPDTIGDGQQIEVVAHYKDGSTSAPFKLVVNVLGAEKSSGLTTVEVDSTPTEAEARKALEIAGVVKLDGQYPNIKYSWAKNSDGTGTVDTSIKGMQTAYVVVDYGDGTKQIVEVSLNVDETNAKENHPVAAAVNATNPILTHLVHDSATGNPVAKTPAYFKNDKEQMKQVITGVNWDQVDFLTWAAAGSSVPGEQNVQVIVHYLDGSISDPVTVKANIIGVQHLDVAGVTTNTEVTPGTQPTPEQAKAALGQELNVADLLRAYPNATFAWASKSDGTGTIDTSKLGPKNAYVVVNYGDGTKQVVKVPLNVTNDAGNPGGSGNSGTPSDNTQPIGGSVTVPQGTDLSQDTKYAEQAISNSASLPMGTTYKWQQTPDTSVAGKTVSASVLVTLPNGTSVVVPVSVIIGTKQGESVTLHHNAYLYDETGQRINEVVFKTGSVVPVYGIKTIAGRDFYILDDNYYLATGNVLSTKQKLIHNAYLYNKYGKRITKQVFKRGKTVITYGEPINIRGKEFYKTDKGYFLRATNFKKPSRDLTPVQSIAADPTKDRVMHNSYLYDENGKRANQIILNAGSRVKIDQTVHSIAGRNFYKTDKGYYIAVENITGTKVSLKHNAYVYNRYGTRANQRTLKQGKIVTVYGDPVTLHGTSYYIVGNKTYVKTANF